MPKLFVALALPVDVRERLGRLVPPDAPGLRLVRPESMHLTLHYIGQGDVPVYETALAAVRMPPFDLRLVRPGCFPDARRPRVLWMGLEESEPLARLHRAVGSALESVGFTPDPRGFTPHVTLARVESASCRGELARILESAPAEWPLMSVTEFILFSSQQQDGRPHYVAERTFALG